MAFAQSLRPVPPSFPMAGADRYAVVQPLSHLALSHNKSRTTVLSSRKPQRKVRAENQESSVSLAADAFANIKHVLLPITDRNPYLSEGSRLAAATTTSLAKKYGADITVVVIDDNPKESIPEHDTQLSSIRWHMSEGGFKEYRLLETRRREEANFSHRRGSR
ncbi:hypothetical protein HPP92_025641 [Vanilla planifolia]|uniref:Uncharacterized protein n=1 Tax=Vanilla planifolia TaxID=51239 RepID=A0A835PMP2_VANPL|nr:hypothetical protein HPP92_025898 [Vanilla planifolia]KAG0454337.1 hypothetical protein HPP92_025641 [Vanilla planifolia]